MLCLRGYSDPKNEIISFFGAFWVIRVDFIFIGEMRQWMPDNIQVKLVNSHKNWYVLVKCSYSLNNMLLVRMFLRHQIKTSLIGCEGKGNKHIANQVIAVNTN